MTCEPATPAGQKDATESDGHRRRFWKTLPGIITATAGLISAFAALVGGLVAAGFIGGLHPLAPTTSDSPSRSPSSSGTPSVTYGSGGPAGGGFPVTGAPHSSPPHPRPPHSSSPSPSTSPSSPPAVMQDQVNDPPWTGGAVNIAPANSDSQVFVPSLPHLVAIEVALTTVNAGRGGDTVVLTVFDGNGQEVATASAAIAEGFDGFYRFDLPAGGAPVNPGQPLTIMLQDSGKIVFGWEYVDGNPYPGGQAYFGGSVFGTNDFLFRTYGTRQ